MGMQKRFGKIERQTSETNIQVSLYLDKDTSKDIKDAKAKTSISNNINSGVDFLDHMLEQVAKHGGFILEVRCQGDNHIDDHHSIEDIGICIGQALDKALGDKEGITRFADRYAPLDEALSRTVIDISGRPNLSLYTQWTASQIGAFDVQLVREFFQGFVNGGKVTLHIDCLRGINCHHQVESMFKSFALALKDATRLSADNAVPSTKGVI